MVLASVCTLIAKVTTLPIHWFVHFYVLTPTLTVSLPLSLSGKVRGVGVAQSYMGTSVWCLWSRPRHPAEPLEFPPAPNRPPPLPLPPLSLLFLCLLSLSLSVWTFIKGGRTNTLFTSECRPIGEGGEGCAVIGWLAGESAMRIGGCRGTGMKTCVRRRWCWWRSCVSAPQEVTARMNAARNSATWWEDADSRTQVTDTPGASHKCFFAFIQQSWLTGWRKLMSHLLSKPTTSPSLTAISVVQV